MEPHTPLIPLAPGWTWIDLALAIGLAVSVVVGLWRGLLTELLALLGWVVASVASQVFGVDAAAHVPVGEPGSRVNLLAGMAVVFVSAWIGWAVLSWGLVQVVKASGLGGTDRLLGALFGLLRGLLVALVLVALVNLTPLAESQPWRTSRSVAWLDVALQGLRPVLPPEVIQFLPTTPPPGGSADRFF